MHNGLCVLDSSSCNKSSACFSNCVSVPNSFAGKCTTFTSTVLNKELLWNYRMGHLSNARLQLLKSYCRLLGLSFPNIFPFLQLIFSIPNDDHGP